MLRRQMVVVVMVVLVLVDDERCDGCLSDDGDEREMDGGGWDVKRGTAGGWRWGAGGM